jgi:hypothetical protein
MPVQICLSAAQELCAVLSAYVEDLSRLPCDVIFPIVLAAATLWQCRKEFDASHDRAEVKAQIDLCVKCLAIVGKIWKNAGDCRRRLIKGGCTSGRFQPRRQLLTSRCRFRWRHIHADTYSERPTIQTNIHRELWPAHERAWVYTSCHDGRCYDSDAYINRRARPPCSSTYRHDVLVPRRDRFEIGRLCNRGRRVSCIFGGAARSI